MMPNFQRRVGIVVRDGNFFVNGAGQNAYFLRKALENAGFECDFLTTRDKDDSSFQHTNMSIVNLASPRFHDHHRYHTIITVTLVLDIEDYNRFTDVGAHVVGFKCGNNYAFWQDEFIYHKEINFDININAPHHSHAIWLIEPHRFTRGLTETITRLPVTMVPHLWSPAIIEMNKPRSALQYDPSSHHDPKIEIVILEPNLGFYKSAWLPLVVAERLHAQHPGKLHKVHLFNVITDAPTKTKAEAMVDKLQISKDGLIERYGRMAIPDVLQFVARRRSQVVILSHQHDILLNYVYYEALFYGFALVHNSPLLQDYGYYYPDHDVSAAVDQVLRAARDHIDHLPDYITRGRRYLSSIDPENPEVVEVYRHLVERGLALAANEAVLKAQAAAFHAAAA